MSWSHEFGDFDGRIWLNTAHQGALPLRAARAARDAVEWKVVPGRLTSERFRSVPADLRAVLGRLVGVDGDEIILANGASHGQHLWADGIPLDQGDEVLLLAADFPSCRLPWLRLRREGVVVREVPCEDAVPSAAEVGQAITERTRVLSLSWVHSFSGRRCDLRAIGEVCRERGVWFLVNATQGLGVVPLDFSTLPVDGVTCAGWKWLCGPYGTGFCWMSPRLLEVMDSRRAYWLAFQTADDLSRSGDPDPERFVGARRFDLFAPANFFQFHPWRAGLELLEEIGLETIRAHSFGLAARIIQRLESSDAHSGDRGRRRYHVRSAVPAESAIVVLEPARARAEDVAKALGDEGIDVAVRRGRIRLAPHLYNDTEQIDRAVAALLRHG